MVIVAGLLVLASAFVAAQPALAQTERYSVPWLVPAGASGEPHGVLRILNDTDESGAVDIYAIDDTGTRTGPASFSLNARAAAEFTAADLVSGNAALGLSGSIGTELADTRLELVTDLDIVPLAFARAPDGTLNAMHDMVRAEARGAALEETGGYSYLVPLFHPASDPVRESRLRLINPGETAASVTIGGRDDSGAVGVGGAVQLTLAAGAALTLSALQLEAGYAGLTGRLGAGAGKWRLEVSSDRPIQVINAVSSASGHLNNLSTTAAEDSGGFRVGSDGSVMDDAEDGEDRNGPLANTYGVGDVVPGVPASGRFMPTALSGASVSTVAGAIDRFPTFHNSTPPGDRAYNAGSAIGALTLPEAGGGNGALRYGLSPAVPGLEFDAAARTLSGTPGAAGTYAMIYTAVDADGDADSLGFTLAVDEAPPGSGLLGICRVGMSLSSGQSCTYPGTAEAFSVNARGRGSFLGRLAGIRIRIDNETIDGRVYDFLASHRGDGVWRIDRIAGSTEPGSTGDMDETAGDMDETAGGMDGAVPRFAESVGPGGLMYTVGTAIDALTLPEASGGNGVLRYGLSPTVPGLEFDAATRTLFGTPGTAGTYALVYTVVDEDGDADSLGFAITVGDAPPGTGLLGICRVGMSLSRGQRCTYPGTADEFSVNARGRGAFLGRLAGIRIRIDNETIDGRVYDFLASHRGEGVWRIDRIAGSMEPGTVGAMDGTVPRFAEGAGPGGLTYFVGAAIGALRLPVAGGGTGTLRYGLSPRVPGLEFDAATRELSGAPSAAGRYDMTYTAIDEAGQADSLAFAIEVENARAAGDFGLASLNGHPRAMEFADGRFLVLDSAEGRLYAYAASGERDSAGDLDLDEDNGSPTGIAFADGRYYVLDSMGDKVYAYTAFGERDSEADFDLDEGNGDPSGIVFANGRLHVVDPIDDKVYAYTASGQRESAADFGLDEGNADPSGIAFANGRFHVADNGEKKVFAYTASGERDAAADFDLDGDNADPSGIAFANGRFHVADLTHDKVYAYTVSGERAARGDHGGVGNPDLAVASPTVSDSEPSAGGSFTVSVTVRNDGGAEAPPATLRFYRSSDSVIDTGDEEVGAHEVDGLAPFGTDSRSIELSAPFSAGTYYYGACVDAVSNEADTANNCSGAARVTVTGSGGTGTPTPQPNPLPSVQNLSVTWEDSENIRVTWDPSPGATYYNVWRCYISDIQCYWADAWDRIAGGITDTTWLDTTVADLPIYVPGRTTPYLEYTVQPCNGGGCRSIFKPHPGR